MPIKWKKKVLTYLFDSPRCGLNNFFPMQNNKCVGVINEFFDIE
jgi:hypothetical protein